MAYLAKGYQKMELWVWGVPTQQVWPYSLTKIIIAPAYTILPMAQNFSRLHWRSAQVSGKDNILVVIDMFTKYAHFITLSYPFSVALVAKSFFDTMFKLHGAPITIISNRGSLFLS